MRQSSRVQQRRLTFLSALALTVFAAGATTAHAGYDEAVTQRITVAQDAFASGGSLDAPPLEQRWSRTLGINVSAPVIAGGRIFVVATEPAHSTPTLFALDSVTGATLWARPTGTGTRIAYDDGALFTFDGGSTVIGMNAATGTTRWTQTLSSGVYAFLATGGKLYLRTGAASTLWALDEADGSTTWTASGTYTDAPESTLAADGANVYAAGSYCTTGAYERGTGRRMWTHNAGCYTYSGRTILGAGRVLATPSQVLDTATGGQLDSFYGGAPAVAGTTSVALNGATLQARSLTRGTLTWQYGGDGKLASAPAVVNATAYVGSSSGRLSAVDLETGREVWATTLTDGSTPTAQTPGLTGMAAAGGVLAVPVGGTLVALDNTSAPRPGLGLRILSGPDRPTSDASAAFSFSAPGALVTQCRIDDADWTACADSSAYAGLQDGPHAFQVRTLDADGRTVALAARSWSVYSVALETQIISGPTGTTRASASFTISTTGNAGMECRLDGASWQSCQGSYSTYAGDGHHVFEARGLDSLGRVDATPASREWTQDTTPPTVSYTSGPGSPTSSPSAQFTFTSSEPGSRFECQLDSGDWTACTSPQRYDGLTGGAHAFSVRAIDAAGNVGNNTAYYQTRYTWTIDHGTRITAQPVPHSAYASAAFAFTSNGTSPTYECRLDETAWAACASGQSYSGLADGSHKFAVRATADGWTDPTPVSATWTVDTTPPETTISSGPSGSTTSSSATFGFGATDADQVGGYECQLDGGAWNPCYFNSQTYSGLGAGDHTFRVRAHDSAGNVDPTPAERTWTVTGPPETTITARPASPSTTTTASFSFASSTSSATFSCRLDGAAWSACTSPQSYSDLGEGSHTFDVRASAFGYDDPTPATATWTVDTAAPDTTIDSPPPGAGSSASFSFHSDDPNATFICQRDGTGWTSCASPTSYGGLADGSHTFAVRARDAAGNADPSPATSTWTVDTTAPETTITSGPGDTTAGGASFAFTASESGSSFNCRMDGAAWTPCSSPTTYAGLAVGPHTFRVAATDGSGNIDASPASVAFTVAAAPPATSTPTAPATTSTDPARTPGAAPAPAGAAPAPSDAGAGARTAPSRSTSTATSASTLGATLVRLLGSDARSIAKARTFLVAFTAPRAETVSVELRAVVHGKRRIVASGAHAFARRGAGFVRITLTPAGRRLLARKGRLAITVATAIRPAGGAVTQRSTARASARAGA